VDSTSSDDRAKGNPAQVSVNSSAAFGALETLSRSG